jgi:hypothetical protein
MTRLVPPDGCPHRKGLEAGYYGDSAAHGDGDTLVIDTTNLKRWMLDEYYETKPGEYRMHSDALHTIERIRWKNPRALSYELTIDPKIFARPWKQEFEMFARPQWDAAGLSSTFVTTTNVPAESARLNSLFERSREVFMRKCLAVTTLSPWQGW